MNKRYFRQLKIGDTRFSVKGLLYEDAKLDNPITELDYMPVMIVQKSRKHKSHPIYVRTEDGQFGWVNVADLKTPRETLANHFAKTFRITQ